MGMFSALLNGITISVTSPDGNVECELGDGRDVVMGFAAGSYRRYTETELARQLAGVLTSLWAGHRHAHLAILEESSGCEVRGDGSRIDPKNRAFTEARRTARAKGRSTSGRISVSTTGLTAWQVNIQPGTVREMDEDTFLNDLWSACLAVIADHRRRLTELRRDVFDTPPQGSAR